MPTPPNRLEALLARLTPEEVPEFRQTIDLFERCGQMHPDEADEWRRRLTEWTDFLFRTEEADVDDPVC